MPKRSVKRAVLNRETLKGLRAIMEDEYPFILQNFLEDSLNLHSAFHQAREADDREKFQHMIVQLSDACSSIGADSLVEVLNQADSVCKDLTDDQVSIYIQQVDQMFMDCRSDIQKELSKTNKLMA